ncbi:PTS sugar transporter subunit IIA [Lactobacillus xylocopicola]|uniref:PTS mannose transporter subunit IIA n=1 Tax=Lactobacillus xylocopicola TaxID=2976676 RepID=A0ABN6SL24_9LACO|nr:PTS sugar transporter subunit IIA [Lactobacillus xylocopicola]BDR60129.1 PTS mannose transporter subunit IIA [Lactobacillus xylocopicola]
MTGVIICTHGSSAPELLNSAEMICGKQVNCRTVNFAMGESLDDLEQELRQAIASLSGPIIGLTDLKGGTPFNILVKLVASQPDMEIVTGVNIPLLLELFINREQVALKELVKLAVEAGKSGVYHYQEETPSKTDEEF